MKMINFKMLRTSLFFSSLLLVQACRKPTEGVIPILTNVSDYTISVQVIDANSATVRQVPDNVSVSLSGDAIDKGLIVNFGENQPGSAFKVGPDGALVLAVTPGTSISKTSPLRFSVSATAPGYIANTRTFVITSGDSLQSANLKLTSVTTPPKGVNISRATLPINDGAFDSKNLVDVQGGIYGKSATLTIPAGTQLLDGSGASIKSTGSAAFTFAHYANNIAASVESIPGGTFRVKSIDGSENTFLVADAFTLNMKMGTTTVKSFSTEIPLDVSLNSESLNPGTGSKIQAGDVIEVWSVNEGSTTWQREKDVTITTTTLGELKASVNLRRLSTYVFGYSVATSANTASVLISDADESNDWVESKLIVQQTGQVLASSLSYINNKLDVSVPKNVAVSVALQQYKSNPDPAVTADLGNNSASSVSVALKPAPKPTPLILNFELATLCSNGLFKYTGPINYKVSGTTAWFPFDKSAQGKLSTKLLEWNVTYDFSVTYKGTTYLRTRKALESEFRPILNKKNTYDYFGRDPGIQQTFFYATDVFCSK